MTSYSAVFLNPVGFSGISLYLPIPISEPIQFFEDGFP